MAGQPTDPDPRVDSRKKIACAWFVLFLFTFGEERWAWQDSGFCERFQRPELEAGRRKNNKSHASPKSILYFLFV